MIELDTSLPPELAPLAWLIGVWEGTGVVSYPVDGDTREYEFGQRIGFSHDGTGYLDYSSTTWLIGDGSSVPAPVPAPGEATDAAPAAPEAVRRHLTSEKGYWRISRPRTPADVGPGMLLGTGDNPYGTSSGVETLRNATDGFDIEVSILHPRGVSELYLGQAKGPRIDLATDAIMRSADAAEHTASTRLYGLVDGHLLWAWDIAALGQPLTSHASARLARVD